MAWLGRVRRAWQAVRYGSQLDRVRTPAELQGLVDRVRPADFLYWASMAAQKRDEIAIVTRHLGFTFRGKRFLDLGPGHGEALDFAHAEGAAACRFVEADPFLFAHNRVKGVATGDRRDFLRWLPDERFDFVWVKASVSPHNFWRHAEARRWMRRVSSCLTPGGELVVCPYWGRRAPSREAAFAHWFSRALLAEGFSPMPYVPGHNEGCFPISFRYHAPEEGHPRTGRRAPLPATPLPP